MAAYEQSRKQCAEARQQREQATRPMGTEQTTLEFPQPEKPRKRWTKKLRALKLPRPSERLDYKLETLHWYICYRANNTAYCDLDYAYLAKKYNVDRDTIRRRVRMLERAGYVNVEPRPGKTNRFRPLVAPQDWHDDPEQNWVQERVTLSARVGQVVGQLASDAVHAMQGAVQNAVESLNRRKNSGGQSADPIPGQTYEGDTGGDTEGLRGGKPSPSYMSLQQIDNKQSTASESESLPAELPAVVVALMEKGIKPETTARLLVDSYGEGRVFDQIEALSYRIAEDLKKNSGKSTIKSPAGLLRLSIVHNYEWPKEMGDRREAAAKEAQRTAERAKQAEEREKNREARALKELQERTQRSQDAAAREHMMPLAFRGGLWLKALSKLAKSLNKPTYEMHLSKSVPLAYSQPEGAERGQVDAVITVCLNSAFSVNYLGGMGNQPKQTRTVLEQVISEILGGKRVRLKLAPPEQATLAFTVTGLGRS